MAYTLAALQSNPEACPINPECSFDDSVAYLASLANDSPEGMTLDEIFAHFADLESDPSANLATNPHAFSAKAKMDPDTLMFHEVMTNKDREHFKASMHEEIQNLEKMCSWQVIECSLIPSTACITPTTWTFHHKCYPDSHVK